MIKQVAAAIAPEVRRYADWVGISDEEIEDIARIAIQAMRAPTEALVQAGMNVGAIPACHGEVTAHWQAMIDAALSSP